MHRGYIALHRKIQDHPFYKEDREFSKYEAWVDILQEVRHSEEPKEVIFGMKILKCFYAESLYSIKTWAKRWNWTESKVRRYFKLLENMKQIETKSEVITTRLKVLNYGVYDPKRSANESQVTSKRSTNDEQATTNKNVKNEKNVKKKETIPPKLKDVEKYCLERKNNINPESFIDHYETNGWMRGKNKIKSWKACIRTWEKNNNNNGFNKPNNNEVTGTAYEEFK